LNTIDFIADLATFSSSLDLAINDCAEREPELPKMYATVKDLKKQYEDTEKQFRDISWKGIRNFVCFLLFFVSLLGWLLFVCLFVCLFVFLFVFF